MNNDVYDVTSTTKEEVNSKRKIEITYYQARFTQKCGAILLDFVVCLLLALGIFTATKAIVESTSYFQEINLKYDEARLNSSLYVYSETSQKVEDVVTFLNKSTTISSKDKETYLYNHIFDFFDSLPDEKESLKEEFYDFVLDKDLVYNGEPYYKLNNEGDLIKNDEIIIPSDAYYNNVLAPYFDNIALAQFVILTPNVLDYQRYQSNMLLFLEIPVALCLSVIIVWYIIPLCFTRGKLTLGRLAFHVGLVGSDNFSVKFGKFTIRFLIFFFAEVILSVFTLCVPLIISLSMSAFTKKKQNFHDYMVGIREIDTYGTVIYKDKYDVIRKDNSSGPVNFKNR